MSIARMLQQVAGAGGLDIADAFSTDLYTGNGSTQTITNGIDLAGEGGLVWIKPRNVTASHYLYNTVLGNTSLLRSDRTDAESDGSAFLTGFNSDGFDLASELSLSSRTYAAWTFRKAPKFFDVVTYTGDSTAGRTVAHNLGIEPGMIVVKRLDGTNSWEVSHRSIPITQKLLLNSSNGVGAGADITGRSDTDFTLSLSFATNGSGSDYVAYLFAHDTEDDGVIQCGSYTGTGSALSINLGWEPQWVLIKRTDNNGSWYIFPSNGDFSGAEGRLSPNLANAESSLNVIESTSTGFDIVQFDGAWNTSSGEYIYVAIRAEGA